MLIRTTRVPVLGTNASCVTVSSLAAATALPSIPANVQYALIQCEGGDVRWRADGTAPTTTSGLLLPAGTEKFFDAGSISSLKFIQVSATAILQVAYYV